MKKNHFTNPHPASRQLLGARLQLPDRRDGERFWAFAEGAPRGLGGKLAEMRGGIMMNALRNHAHMILLNTFLLSYILYIYLYIYIFYQIS